MALDSKKSTKTVWVYLHHPAHCEDRVAFETTPPSLTDSRFFTTNGILLFQVIGSPRWNNGSPRGARTAEVHPARPRKTGSRRGDDGGGEGHRSRRRKCRWPRKGLGARKRSAFQTRLSCLSVELDGESKHSERSMIEIPHS